MTAHTTHDGTFTMFSLRNVSIRNKMTLLACLSAGAAMLLTCLGFAALGVHTLRRAKLDQLKDRAQVLAFYSSPVVTVGDKEAGKRILSSLQSDPTIEAARILDKTLQPVAVFGAGLDDADLQHDLLADGHRFVRWTYVEVVQPVIVSGQRLGMVHLRANTADLKSQLNEFARVAGYVLAIAMSVALLLSARLQRAISRPIVALTAVAHQISSEGDYSIRVNGRAGAELATLQDAFNRMLAQIEKAEGELQSAHDKLEERVAERTAELSDEISRRVIIQADLEKAKEAAEAASRAKSEFLANMSHELRTPLNGIVGFADLLMRDANQLAKQEHREFLETIQRSSVHLLDLISDVLDLSKIEAGRMDVEKIACAPHRVISETISILAVRAAEKGLPLTYAWSGEMPRTIESDPARLRQLLFNLVSNAIKFTEKGSIQVLVGLDQSQTDPKLRLKVIDSGIGIPPDKLEDIFDPFMQADNSVTRRFGGTGLGLAICRNITSALGGDLTVTSILGEGSTFTATIDTGPLEDVTMMDSSEFDSEDAPQGHENLRDLRLPPARILVVDDGDTNRKLIKLLLSRAGAQPETAEDGQQALEMATAASYDLILMDMQMPVLDGYTATQRLRQLGHELPIIALTAHAMKGDEEKCLAAGCSGYMTKPVDADRLLLVVGKALGANLQTTHPTPRAVRSDAASAPPAVPRSPDSPRWITSTLPLDDVDFLEIVEEFVERLQQKLDDMRSALANHDGPTLANIAHWLKGAGGTAGFHVLTDPARALEEHARGLQFEAAEVQLQQIEAFATRIVADSVPPA